MKKQTKKKIKVLGVALFVCYLIALIYFLFFAEGYGRVSDAEAVYHYNLIPFQEIQRFWKYRDVVGSFAMFTNLAGNIVGFMPLGFILPVLSKRFRSGVFIVFLGFLLSLLVESLQLVTRLGIFDVDDLILNTLGTMFGYLVFWICDLIRRI